MALNLKARYESGLEWEAWLASDDTNVERMRANYKAVTLTEADLRFLEGVERAVHILAIGEAWCGDVARQFPIMARMAAASPNLHMRIIGRDDQLDVMERYLSNGGLAIPVFVFFNDQFIEVGNWKARPARCREIIARGRAAGRLAEAKNEIAGIMDDTQGRLTIDEIQHLIDMALS
jgi:hypothetical protein